ncbi:hypothetical protein ACE6H2_026367 [Prunus campanulata]
MWARHRCDVGNFHRIRLEFQEIWGGSCHGCFIIFCWLVVRAHHSPLMRGVLCDGATCTIPGSPLGLRLVLKHYQLFLMGYINS